jgi:hypothetical protein
LGSSDFPLEQAVKKDRIASSRPRRPAGVRLRSKKLAAFRRTTEYLMVLLDDGN